MTNTKHALRMPEHDLPWPMGSRVKFFTQAGIQAARAGSASQLWGARGSNALQAASKNRQAAATSHISVLGPPP